VDDLGFIVAGYAITLGALAGYVGALFARARRARAQAAAVAAARAGDGRPAGRPSPA
jgi:hypothetical protein